MATYYINADTGNDNTGDGSASSPWLTISHAKDNVVDNDTIICQNAAAAYLFERLTIANTITIQGQSLSAVVFSTTSDILEGWKVDSGKTLTLKTITFSDCAVNTSESYSYLFTGDMVVEQCIFMRINITTGGLAWASGIFNRIYSNFSTYVFNSCLFYDIYNEGIILRFSQNGLETNITFNNCTFDLQENQTILCGQNDPPTSIKNCIIYNNTGGATAISTYTGQLGSNTTFDYNCVYGVFSNPITGTGNLLNTDPLFIDPANNNYNLSPSSPCIDAGTLI
jgi:hypothetical protein